MGFKVFFNALKSFMGALGMVALWVVLAALAGICELTGLGLKFMGVQK